MWNIFSNTFVLVIYFALVCLISFMITVAPRNLHCQLLSKIIDDRLYSSATKIILKMFTLTGVPQSMEFQYYVEFHTVFQSLLMAFTCYRIEIFVIIFFIASIFHQSLSIQQASCLNCMPYLSSLFRTETATQIGCLSSLRHCSSYRIREIYPNNNCRVTRSLHTRFRSSFGSCKDSYRPSNTQLRRLRSPSWTMLRQGIASSVLVSASTMNTEIINHAVSYIDSRTAKAIDDTLMSSAGPGSFSLHQLMELAGDNYLRSLISISGSFYNLAYRSTLDILTSYSRIYFIVRVECR